MQNIKDFLSSDDIKRLKETFGDFEDNIIEYQIYFEISKALEKALKCNTNKNCIDKILRSIGDLKANYNGYVNIGDNIYNAKSIDEIMVARMLPGIKYYNKDGQLIVIQLEK